MAFVPNIPRNLRELMAFTATDEECRHTAAASGCTHAVSVWSGLHTATFQPFGGRKGATSFMSYCQFVIAFETTFAGLILIC